MYLCKKVINTTFLSMKRFILQFFAVLLFFASLGVNVVHYGCDACREYFPILMGQSCMDVHHSVKGDLAICCTSSCDDSEAQDIPTNMMIIIKIVHLNAYLYLWIVT